MKDMTEKHFMRGKFTDVIYYGLFCFIAVFLFWKCRIGYANLDEAFYLSVPFRLCQGDGLFIHEWNWSMLSSVPVYPIMKIYLLLFSGTEGILLHFRWIFTFVWSMSALFTGIRMRQYSKTGAYAASLAVLIYAPFGIMALSYNSLGILLLLDACVLFATAKRKRTDLILSGICFSGAVLCCPFLAALYGLFVAVTVIFFIFGGKKERKGRIHRWIYLTIGCGLVFLLFCVLVFSRCSVSDFVKAYPWITKEPTRLNHSMWYKVKEYFETIISATSQAKWILILTAVSSVVCRLYKKLRPIGLSLVCVGVAAFLLDFIFHKPYINHLMLPMALMGLFCVTTSDQQKIKKLFCYLWIPGFLYSFIINITSDQHLYAISSTMTVAAFASIIMIPMYIREFSAEQNTVLKAVSVAAVILLVSLQLSSELVFRYNSIFWEKTVEDQNVTATKGPEKGIRMTAEKLDAYNDLLAGLDTIKENPEPYPVIFWVSDSTVAYLYTQKPIAAISTWLSGESIVLEKLEQYYLLNPEKKPAIVCIDKEYMSVFYPLYIYYSESGYKLIDENDRMIFMSDSLPPAKEMEVLSDVEFRLDSPSVQLANAEMVDGQYNGKPGIVCKGNLQRDPLDAEVSLEDYLFNTEYIGFKFETEEMRPVRRISFFGKKIKDHGQPTVVAYDKEGNAIAQFAGSYQNIDAEWHEYFLFLPEVDGPITVIFNGGYVDRTGSPESQFVFSNVVLHNSMK